MDVGQESTIAPMEEGKDLRFNIPKLITKLNQGRSRCRGTQAATTKPPKTTAKMLPMTKNRKSNPRKRERRKKIPSAIINLNEEFENSSNSLMKNDKQKVLINPETTRIIPKEKINRHPRVQCPRKEIDGSNQAMTERVELNKTKEAVLRQQVHKNLYKPNSRHGRGAQFGSFGSPSLRKKSIMDGSGIESIGQTFDLDMKKHGFVKDLNNLNNFTAFFEQP